MSETDVLNISGQTALITGAAKRLGRAAATALARAGANVVVHYGTSADAAEDLAAALKTMGAQAWTLQADLAEPGACASIVDRAVETAGPLDILVNSASIFPSHRWDGFERDTLEENVTINAWAPFVLSKAFYEQARPGAIINMLDTMIEDYDRTHVPYHLSKRMLFTMTRLCAVEFAPRVRVNGVAPGLVLPPPGQDASYLIERRESNLLKRIGSPEGIAEAIVFLARGGFITGQVLYVDGGRHLLGKMYG